MGLNLEVLTLASLADFSEGEIAVAWQQALERVTRDNQDRPALRKPRKVVLTLELTPVADSQGNHMGDEMDVQIDEKYPARRTDRHYALETRLGPNNKPQLVFNKFDSDNPNQMTMDEVFQPDEEEERDE